MGEARVLVHTICEQSGIIVRLNSDFDARRESLMQRQSESPMQIGDISYLALVERGPRRHDKETRNCTVTTQIKSTPSRDHPRPRAIGIFIRPGSIRLGTTAWRPRMQTETQAKSCRHRTNVSPGEVLQ